MKLPKRMPTVVAPPRTEVTSSPALSLTFRPGDGTIRGRKIAILIAPGVERGSVLSTEAGLTIAGAVVRRLAATLATVEAADGDHLEPDATFETMPAVLFDAMIVPDGEESTTELASLGQAVEFTKDQYRHCKPILFLGAGQRFAIEAGVPVDEDDWAVVRDQQAFIEAVGRHRNWDRATDPPVV